MLRYISNTLQIENRCPNITSGLKETLPEEFQFFYLVLTSHVPCICRKASALKGVIKPYHISIVHSCSGNTTLHSVCVVEVHVTVNCIKMLSVA